jgi:hypothetical protein
MLHRGIQFLERLRWGMAQKRLGNFGLEVNTEKIKYMLLSRHQNAGQNHDVKIGNRWFENGAQLRYLGTTIRNQNLIQEEIKRRYLRNLF